MLDESKDQDFPVGKFWTQYQPFKNELFEFNCSNFPELNFTCSKYFNQLFELFRTNLQVDVNCLKTLKLNFEQYKLFVFPQLFKFLLPNLT